MFNRWVWRLSTFLGIAVLRCITAWITSQVGMSTGSYGWKGKAGKCPQTIISWLLDQLLCLNSLGGLLTSLASPHNPPTFFSPFILSTHTDEHTHAWPATPDDWLFVCAEEFTLRCVRGNWSPCGPVPITGPPPEGCSAFPMIVGRDSKRVLKDGFHLGGWDSPNRLYCMFVIHWRRH